MNIITFLLFKKEYYNLLSPVTAQWMCPLLANVHILNVYVALDRTPTLLHIQRWNIWTVKVSILVGQIMMFSAIQTWSPKSTITVYFCSCSLGRGRGLNNKNKPKAV